MDFLWKLIRKIICYILNLLSPKFEFKHIWWYSYIFERVIFFLLGGRIVYRFHSTWRTPNIAHSVISESFSFTLFSQSFFFFQRRGVCGIWWVILCLSPTLQTQLKLDKAKELLCLDAINTSHLWWTPDYSNITLTTNLRQNVSCMHVTMSNWVADACSSSYDNMCLVYNY